MNLIAKYFSQILKFDYKKALYFLKLLSISGLNFLQKKKMSRWTFFFFTTRKVF